MCLGTRPLPRSLPAKGLPLTELPPWGHLRTGVTLLEGSGASFAAEKPPRPVGGCRVLRERTAVGSGASTLGSLPGSRRLRITSPSSCESWVLVSSFILQMGKLSLIGSRGNTADTSGGSPEVRAGAGPCLRPTGTCPGSIQSRRIFPPPPPSFLKASPRTGGRCLNAISACGQPLCSQPLSAQLGPRTSCKAVVWLLGVVRQWQEEELILLELPR